MTWLIMALESDGFDLDWDSLRWKGILLIYLIYSAPLIIGVYYEDWKKHRAIKKERQALRQRMASQPYQGCGCGSHHDH